MLRSFLLTLAWLSLVSPSLADVADVILHNGKVVTVDQAFSLQQAVAIGGNKLLAVGTNDEVLKLRGPKTEVLDLRGGMVLPGLMDSHVHPTGAAMHEWDHPIPDMETIQDVLNYIGSRAKTLDKGQWIVVRQVFITRLKEQRYPTKAELDAVAPEHPVMFSTGPDASVNSLALKLSGIDKDFKGTGTGKIEKDPMTGEPTGILRSAGHYIKSSSKSRSATTEQRDEQLRALFADYNSVGLTTVSDRNCGNDSLTQYARLKGADKLTVRMKASMGVSPGGKVSEVEQRIKQVAANSLRQKDPWVQIVGIKMFLDGGMLTGSAYMREPWGVSKIYSIDDPRYQGLRYIEPDHLQEIVRITVENGLQFTAHSVGDGAVHTLLDAYAEVNKSLPIRATRPCITHSNFMSLEAVQQAAKLGVVLDIQPAWLNLDGKTLLAQFGYDRLRYFQPLSTIFKSGGIVGGGSDHMQKIGSLRSINFYNPFLAMQTAVTRLARGLEQPLHPEEALTREQMIRYYTINNAVLLFCEDQLGSLEVGKLADLIVVDRDLLECDAMKIRDTQVLRTYLDGKLVYKK